MRLTALGTATPYPRPDHACSGYLLEAGEARVWVDAGPGTLANLQRHAAVDELSAIWISHLHADHTADLLPAFYALAYADLTPARPIPVYGPPGWAARVEHFLTNGSPQPMSRVFEAHELADGHRADVAGLRLTSRAVEHGLPAFGLRAEHGGAVLAYSGDTRACPALDELAAGADVFVCEADGGPPYHCSPEDAGESARRAGAGRLVVTHVGHTVGDAAGRASEAYGRAVEAAYDGMVIEAG
ncbi:MBL fold metallo-hydrolase [Bailinhaonella thermotolerans]|uniref:MBL fold metallo-hydrolase n=1 Tax=Bailinhaonella thermotolerans TaxID=1070861 RepID=A0A3A4B787_9ACTN|nr:MBL fold metallo-hydrolase [Bailinhaonella thermotolerans]RJL34437.1 MBL fold metallo-hydrolase [Bailinhaonella thermotolerans]